MPGATASDWKTNLSSWKRPFTLAAILWALFLITFEPWQNQYPRGALIFWPFTWIWSMSEHVYDGVTYLTHSPSSTLTPDEFMRQEQMIDKCLDIPKAGNIFDQLQARSLQKECLIQGIEPVPKPPPGFVLDPPEEQLKTDQLEILNAIVKALIGLGLLAGLTGLPKMFMSRTK